MQILETAQDLIEYIQVAHADQGMERWYVISEYLVALINENPDIIYNERYFNLACERLGLDLHYNGIDLQATNLSRLVYNAQGVAHERHMREAGYEPFTQQVIEEAYRRKMILQQIGGQVLHVRFEKLVGHVIAYLPRNRKRYYEPNPTAWVKIVPKDVVLPVQTMLLPGIKVDEE